MYRAACCNGKCMHTCVREMSGSYFCLEIVYPKLGYPFSAIPEKLWDIKFGYYHFHHRRRHRHHHELLMFRSIKAFSSSF
jgi:hypothetical protein